MNCIKYQFVALVARGSCSSLRAISGLHPVEHGASVYQCGPSNQATCEMPRNFSGSSASCSGDPRQKAMEMGKEEQAKALNMLKRVAPQTVQQPKRTPAELLDAEMRSKEYSRLKMKFHKDGERRLRLRAAVR